MRFNARDKLDKALKNPSFKQMMGDYVKISIQIRLYSKKLGEILNVMSSKELDKINKKINRDLNDAAQLYNTILGILGHTENISLNSEESKELMEIKMEIAKRIANHIK